MCNENCSHCQEKEQTESIAFASSNPYPPVCVIERNQMYGRMMLDNMGGNCSEMSAVSLYLYNNLLIDDNERISHIFHKVSIIEMKHLRIFGQIARMMGENPRLWTYRGNRMAYWTPAYNNYPLELPALLMNAINGEKSTVQKYEQQCQKINDPNIVACLKRIIEDEKIHICIFESLYEEYCR